MSPAANNQKVYEDLYWTLNRMYSSGHSDSPEETRQAIDLLKTAIETNQYRVETILLKMRQLNTKSEQEGIWKPKLFITIYGRFWEKTLVNMIESRKFKME